MKRCRRLLLAVSLCLASCTGVPEGIEPVQSFEAEPYLGTWYEIARLNHDFEEGLQRVTATYQQRDDGGIDVINRGFNVAEERWEQAKGKAYFVQAEDVGHLKVSFFGPFYSSYVVFELGQDYQYAFVTGPSREYLWLLARQPEVSEALRNHFLARAEALGFAIDQLIFVEQQ